MTQQRTNKKPVSKKRKQAAADFKQKNQRNPQIPFYHEKSYLSPNREYVVSGLTGAEMNMIRSAMLHYVRSNQDISLWDNMDKFTAIRNKLDSAKAVRATTDDTNIEDEEIEE